MKPRGIKITNLGVGKTGRSGGANNRRIKNILVKFKGIKKIEQVFVGRVPRKDLGARANPSVVHRGGGRVIGTKANRKESPGKKGHGVEPVK